MDTRTRDALAAARAVAMEELERLLLEQAQLRDRIVESSRLIRNLSTQLGEDVPSQALVEDTHETRVGAVLRMVLRSPSPVSPTEVREELALEGRQETIKAVSSALSYLSAKGDIASAGRGLWTTS